MNENGSIIKGTNITIFKLCEGSPRGTIFLTVRLILGIASSTTVYYIVRLRQ